MTLISTETADDLKPSLRQKLAVSIRELLARYSLQEVMSEIASQRPAFDFIFHAHAAPPPQRRDR